MIPRLLLSGWLVYLALADIRHGQVTNWATVPPLLGAVAWRILRGEWVIGLLLALSLAVAQWPQLLPLGVVGAMACLPWATLQGVDTALMVWLLALALWLLDVLGGADVKTVMTLITLFPDARLGWLLLLAWGGLSLMYVLQYHGRSAPRVLLSTLWTIGRLQRRPDVHRSPALPAAAIGGLLYLWFCWSYS